LGPFEYGLNAPPRLTMGRTGNLVILSGAGGPAGGTNYLLATSSLSSPAWTRITTNKFDLLGNVSVTNAVDAGAGTILYRVQLP